MKRKIHKRALAFFLALSILSGFGHASASGIETLYENKSVLAEGFSRTESIWRSSGGKRVESYAVEIGPDSGVYPITLACDTIYGGLTITEMIRYAESQGYTVLGAVNSDFGYFPAVIPCGMAVENGIYKTSADDCNALAFTAEGAFVSLVPRVKITLTNDASGESVSTFRLNKSRDDSGLFLYSEHFSTVSTRTSTEGWMVRLEILEGQLTVQGEMKLRVAEIYQGNKAQPIGEGCLILTASEAAGLESEMGKFAVGDTVTLRTQCSDERLAEADWVCGCGNLLALEGQLYGNEESWDPSVSGSHPRTVVGVRADGSMVFMAIDGRSATSGGATLRQAAEKLLADGCETVVNMDGGGSTALALRSPESGQVVVVNSPSDGALRRCAGYILFVTEADGEAGSRLYCAQDGVFVAAGSGIDLQFFAADGSLTPLALSQPVSLTSSAGSYADGRYLPDVDAGSHSISFAAGGLEGSATIHVIEKADSLTVLNTESGAEVKALELYAGDSVALSVSVQYLLRDVIVDDAEIEYSCDEAIGSASPEGLFTAAGEGGASGTITVSAAGLTAEIPVSIQNEFSDISGHWAREPILSLYRAGIVNGTDHSSFSPNAEMKRGDFILMLYRACGQPAVSGGTGYSDVAPEDYYGAAITWAQQQGIAKGYTDGTFCPEESLSRQQAFTFVYRSLALLGLSVPESDSSVLDDFSDAGSLADYAKEAAAALVSMGVISGDGSGCLSPEGNLTRAQMAKILDACLALA